MITKWTLKNFKPITNLGDLSLRPLTVLAGLNSTGKSSLIQSILAVSQTLANPIPEKALILNGNGVQLGTFSSVLNEHSTDGVVGLGFTYRATTPSTSRDPARSTRIGRFRGLESLVAEVSVDATFAAPTPGSHDVSGIEAVKVRLSGSRLRVDVRISGDPRGDSVAQELGIDVSLRPASDEAQAEFLSDVAEEFRGFLPSSSEETYFGTIQGDPRQFLARPNHFLPDRLLAKFSTADRARRELTLAVETLFTHGYQAIPPGSLREVASGLPARPVSDALRADLTRLAQTRKSTPYSARTLQDVVRWTQESPLKTKAKFNFARSVKEAIVGELLRDHVASRAPTQPNSGIESITDELPVALVEASAQLLVTFFSTMVRYLGPLRADPQAPQRFSPSNEPDDVGAKGEFAAAVYDANRKQQISWWNPISNSVERGILADAVNVWAEYLGIAHSVTTREAGLSGVSWVVKHLPSSTERPLQAVGVGVSQVLPILVAGLLAPRGGLILIEQPELHLHARAQARLGDFLAGLARIGKQCIVETHSDCMVNQLRLRIVQESASFRDFCAIYFVSQSTEGDTQFESIQISHRGAILNWPDGFFDVSLLQEDEITRASLGVPR